MELRKITLEALKETIAQARAACRGFDGDAMMDLARRISGYACNGIPLKDSFEKAAQLADDFEYEAAEEELIRLEEQLERE